MGFCRYIFVALNPPMPKEPQCWWAARADAQAEPQTRVGGARARGRNQDGFLQLSKLLLPIIVLRLACVLPDAERANAKN